MQVQGRIHLLIIDPQNDFCGQVAPASADGASDAGGSRRPALPVSGADADMQRLAHFLRRAGPRLERIFVTLDQHHPVHIANPAWWIGPDGAQPQAFTNITGQDVRSGRWRARNPAWQARTLAYLEALEQGARYALVVWPEHCLIGHWGADLHSAVAEELDAWERRWLKLVEFLPKGSNPFTEHYSAVRAEVPDPADPATGCNRRLISALSEADAVIVAGEALSHCVANTVRDIAGELPPGDIARFILLTDCTSSVAGFEDLGTGFMQELCSRGMRSASSSDLVI
jgi:nicotinamidase-related amidase